MFPPGTTPCVHRSFRSFCPCRGRSGRWVWAFVWVCLVTLSSHAERHTCACVRFLLRMRLLSSAAPTALDGTKWERNMPPPLEVRQIACWGGRHECVCVFVWSLCGVRREAPALTIAFPLARAVAVWLWLPAGV